MSIYDKHLNQRHFVTFGKHWNLFLSRQTPLGELTTLTRPLVGWGDVSLLIPDPSRCRRKFGVSAQRLWHPTWRLWCFILGVFGDSNPPHQPNLRPPPSCAFWICPWLHTERYNTACKYL